MSLTIDTPPCQSVMCRADSLWVSGFLFLGEVEKVVPTFLVLCIFGGQRQSLALGS